jgi:hypothetical protein
MMNVLEITDERLQFWANSIARNGDTDTAEKIAMARELLDRRAPSAVEKELRELVSAAMEVIEPPPDSNCSCHINPPCNDCVEWSGLREWFEAASALLAKKGS